MYARFAKRTTPAKAIVSRKARISPEGDDGMATAEYAVGTVAAAGFAGILWKILTSEWVVELLKALFSKAFDMSFL